MFRAITIIMLRQLMTRLHKKEQNGIFRKPIKTERGRKCEWAASTRLAPVIMAAAIIPERHCLTRLRIKQQKIFRLPATDFKNDTTVFS